MTRWLTCFFLAIFGTSHGTALAQYGRIGTSQQLDLKKLYTELAQHEISSFLLAHHVAERGYLVSIEINFDEARLTADEKAFHDRQISERWRALQESQKQIFKIPAELPSNPASGGKSEGLRFGRLNIDLEAENLNRLLNAVPSANDSNININYSLPVVGKIEPFTFSAADYIAQIRVTVQLPSTTPSQLFAELKTKLANAMQLSKIPHQDSTADWIKISHLPKPGRAVKPSASHAWFAKLIAPENASLAIVFAVFVLGVFMIVATLVLAQVFTKVATGIASLAPRPESLGSGPVDPPKDPIVINDGPVHVSESIARSEYYPKNQVLTSEMSALRDRFIELALENESLVAELILDSFYQESGLHDIRDLINFLGHKDVHRLLGKLPETNLTQLQEFIEDSSGDAVSVLSGADVAQRIYRDAVFRLAIAKDQSELKRLREFLLTVEDETLCTKLPALPAYQVALIIRSLTVERSNTVASHLPIETMRDLAKHLDATPEGVGQIVDEVVKQLEAGGEKKQIKSNTQLQFVLRIAKKATLDTEATVLEMIGPTDWDIARKVMETRFLYLQIHLLDSRFLRQALETTPLTTRAEFLAICDENVRNRVLATYKAGTKIKDLILKEMERTLGNKDRLEALFTRKESVVQMVMKTIRDQLRREPAELFKALKARAKQEGVPLPDHWHIPTTSGADTEPSELHAELDDITAA